MAQPFAPLAPILAAALALSACGTHAAPGAPESASGGKGQACGGSAGPSCGPTDYCRIERPFSPAKAGVCTPRPEMCPMIYQPVCGVDGKTYPNACHAERQGANIARDGACAK